MGYQMAEKPSYEELEQRIRELEKQNTATLETQKALEEALRESEETFRAILDAPPIGIAFAQNRIMKWGNRALHEMAGYEEGSLSGKDIRIVYPDREEYERAGWALYKPVREKGIGHVETRWVTKDGRLIDCFIQVNPIDPNDESKGVIASVLDITDRKRAEERIHALTHELMKAQESERQMISRELHDRVAQDLSSLKIAWETLFDNHPIPREIRQRISAISKTLQGTIRAVRDLSYDLRPPGLDEMGLVETISQYCEELPERTGLTVEFTSAGMDGLRLGFDPEINLYRLVQEGLNNIWKHAEATRSSVSLVAAYPNIILRIMDNGKGFDVAERLATIGHEKRMGLRSMEERVRLLRGKMKIQSRAMKGTKISITIPYVETGNDSEEIHIDR